MYVRKIRTLVIGSPALSQVIRHLLSERPEFEIVGSIGDFKRLAVPSGRRAPELIVASVKPVRTEICSAVGAIKNSSPLSKLILICPSEDLLTDGRRCGADTCLAQERLVLRLLPAARALSKRGPVRS